MSEEYHIGRRVAIERRCGMSMKANCEICRKQFDDDVRELVEVKIVHGFWKKEDERRIRLVVSDIPLPEDLCVDF